MAAIIEIDGNGLSVADLVKIGYSKVQVKVSDDAWEAVAQGRKVIDDILQLRDVLITTHKNHICSKY
jgi:histidine ammonia-lyase